MLSKRGIMKGSILLVYLLFLSVLFLGVVQADHVSCHKVTTTGSIETSEYINCKKYVLYDVHNVNPTLFDNNCLINRNCKETDITKLNPRGNDLMHFDSTTGDKICEVLGYGIEELILFGILVKVHAVSLMSHLVHILGIILSLNF